MRLKYEMWWEEIDKSTTTLCLCIPCIVASVSLARIKYPRSANLTLLACPSLVVLQLYLKNRANKLSYSLLIVIPSLVSVILLYSRNVKSNVCCTVQGALVCNYGTNLCKMQVSTYTDSSNMIPKLGKLRIANRNPTLNNVASASFCLGLVSSLLFSKTRWEKEVIQYQ